MFTFLSTTGDAGAMGTWGTLIMVVIMIAVFYFFAIRPQKKQEKETQAMRSALSIGDEIVTIGGIVGIITNAVLNKLEKSKLVQSDDPFGDLMAKRASAKKKTK